MVLIILAMEGPPSVHITVSRHPLLSTSTFLLASTIRSGLSQLATTNSPVTQAEAPSQTKSLGTLANHVKTTRHPTATEVM